MNPKPSPLSWTKLTCLVPPAATSSVFRIADSTPYGRRVHFVHADTADRLLALACLVACVGFAWVGEVVSEVFVDRLSGPTEFCFESLLPGQNKSILRG